MPTKTMIMWGTIAVILITAVILSSITKKETTTLSFEEPEHYKTTIAESNSSEHLITLEMYEDTTARMIFDYKNTEGAPQQITLREELGSWQFNDDASAMTLELHSFRELDTEEAVNIDPPTNITFIRTPNGIEAVTYDKQRYPYDFWNFIPVPEDEMYRYGDFLAISQ